MLANLIERIDRAFTGLLFAKEGRPSGLTRFYYAAFLGARESVVSLL